MFVEKTQATAKLISPKGNPITIIGTDAVRDAFEPTCLTQIQNIADAPGIDRAVLNPDGHLGYGCPVGSVFSSRTHIYPNAVGPDVCCSMSFLQLDLPTEAIDDKATRRALINAIADRIPLGPGGHQGQKADHTREASKLARVACGGANAGNLSELGIDPSWAQHCEQPSYGDEDELFERLHRISKLAPPILGKLAQIGGVGGGNHFLECNAVDVQPGMEDIARNFGLKHGNIGFLNHFGSRGFGYMLTTGNKQWPGQFKKLERIFDAWGIPYPGGEKENVYCPVGSPEADEYLMDMHLGANFAVVNHLLVCRYVLEAFREVLGESIKGELVYHISHNIIREEVIDGHPTLVHRKGATRALPAEHFALRGTAYETSGHPILLPGNPIEGSTIMVGLPGSAIALNSVNHGAGRAMGRRAAARSLDQVVVDAEFDAADILTNCRTYPLDEASAAYKPYEQVIESVEKAGLAATVARLRPRFLLKDSDQRKETSA